MSYFLNRIWNPAICQGGNIKRRYYEGWYFKNVDFGNSLIFSVIPGVSFSEDGKSSHAFVQVVTSGGKFHYFSYPIESFTFSQKKPFSIQIGENTFSEFGMKLRLQDKTTKVYGDITFGEWTPWPVTAFSPGIMGFYRFVPGMETYHGVLSMDHEIFGEITFDGKSICFDQGRGYIEKDWGHSFPSSWIWAQSNHFDHPSVSLVLSVAKIPWMHSSFIGNIAGLLLDGKLHRFTTYTGAKLALIEVEANEAHLILRDKREELDVKIHGGETLSLKAPVLGTMEGHDAESLGGSIDVRLNEIRGEQKNLIFQGTGKLSGIEFMNNRNELCSPF